ncbi:OmpH family outer membrane protein [Salinisphaera sp. T31B1]|uniref:OmpH family outer membrane protein n=1 Tax=Salinisphaera sp. T31B1 TaxID=727963 RepID=UPI003342A64E
MKLRRHVLALVGICLLAWAASAGAQELKIGVVDLGRLINDSPQAERAKTNMASQFAERKNEIESQANTLRQDVERLKRDGSVMSEDGRDKLQASIRDRQRELQMQQSKYNDDVADAEQKEFDRMRSDIRSVIDNYAEEQGYDLILGDSVLYADDAIDVTDEILAQLKQR